MPYNTKEKQRAWAESNRDKVRVNARNYSRRKRHENPGCFYTYEPYGKKRSARRKVYHALHTGKLEWWPCEVCGSYNALAHHDDYSKPLEVRWLCPIHHKEAHNAKAG